MTPLSNTADPGEIFGWLRPCSTRITYVYAIFVLTMQYVVRLLVVTHGLTTSRSRVHTRPYPHALYVTDQQSIYYLIICMRELASS